MRAASRATVRRARGTLRVRRRRSSRGGGPGGGFRRPVRAIDQSAGKPGLDLGDQCESPRQHQRLAFAHGSQGRCGFPCVRCQYRRNSLGRARYRHRCQTSGFPAQGRREYGRGRNGGNGPAGRIPQPRGGDLRLSPHQGSTRPGRGHGDSDEELGGRRRPRKTEGVLVGSAEPSGARPCAGLAVARTLFARPPRPELPSALSQPPPPHDRNSLPPPPKYSHGTHVAGILAANWPGAKQTALDQPIQGICPDLEIYDMRVLGPDADEFTVIAALQFVRYLTPTKDLLAVHGVNLSMSVPHDVANYACGRTPVCEECDRVVANGVVVVTAAGNRGFNKLAQPEGGAAGDYRYISITDPGNADSVITVGSTHRFMPHSYGVSYFSSRGPTGDGRTKPDLVAPGERIDSCVPDGDYDTMDGTSMAAPHVSGAAALLIGRYRELIGQPRRVKEILVKSATDLGREPRFQGAGMLDVLRALQSV